MNKPRRIRLLAALAAVLLTSTLGATPASAGKKNATATDDLRQVLLVGNNWEGTADVIDVATYQTVKRLNIIPDNEERMAEIQSNPDKLAFFLFIQQQIGEGHNQYVDDLYASNDGRTLFISRPSFADVVAIDIASGQVTWRTPVEGYRADHMAISPDGTELAVSASTANKVHLIDTATGQITGEFPSGDSPHENVYVHGGEQILHASIGRVYTPLDEPTFDAGKGERVLQFVDANTREVTRKIDVATKLKEFDPHGDMSSAVRPLTHSPDERFLYFQVSFFHGFIEYDLEQDKITRIAHLPVAEETQDLRRDEYILDSAHHGIAMSGDGTKICVAGTMSNYAGIVNRETFRYRIHQLGARTYWATSSADGRHCYVSVAGDDSVSVISYETEEEVARIPVGNPDDGMLAHPQRARNARIAAELLG